MMAAGMDAGATVSPMAAGSALKAKISNKKTVQ